MTATRPHPAAGPPSHPDTLLSALADGTRNAVLDAVALHGPTTATRLAAELPVSRQAVARHLAILADAGLVHAEASGRETLYRVVPGSLRPLREWLDATDRAWERRLGRLQERLAQRRRLP